MNHEGEVQSKRLLHRATAADDVLFAFWWCPREVLHFAPPTTHPHTHVHIHCAIVLDPTSGCGTEVNLKNGLDDRPLVLELRIR